MTEFMQPTYEELLAIANQFNKNGPFTINRIMTGLCHYVYAVKGEKERFVIRICHPTKIDFLKGHLFWSEELKDKQLPFAKTLYSSIGKEKYDYVILEYIEGIDLGDVIDKMGDKQIKNVVEKLIAYDEIAQELPLAQGYGWGFNFKCSELVSSWPQVVNHALVRAKDWIHSVGKVDPAYVDKVEKLSVQFDSHFKSVKPRAFFHDLTTKNLLLSPKDFTVIGFVDIDEMGFGDKLFHLSLMNMALLSNDHKNHLVDIWLDTIQATDKERQVLKFYTLIHCVTFMGENGKYFNKESSFSDSYHSKLVNIYEKLINSFKQEKI